MAQRAHRMAAGFFLLLYMLGLAWVASAGEMIAHYRFDTNSLDSLGKSPAFVVTNADQLVGTFRYTAFFTITNPPFTNGALFVDGRYEPNGSRVHYLGTGPIEKFHYEGFSVSFDYYPLPAGRSVFGMNKFERTIDSWTRGGYSRLAGYDPNFWNARNILTGGTWYRWFGLNREGDVLNLTLNNQAFTHRFAKAAVTPNRWHHLVCSVDLRRREFLTMFDGQLLETVTLPADFKLAVGGKAEAPGDREFTFINFSNGSVYYGYAANLKIFDGSMTEAEMAALYNQSIAERPKLPKDVHGSHAIAVSVVLIIAVCLVALFFIRRRRRLRAGGMQ
jgi:hypothetical protein